MLGSIPQGNFSEFGDPWLTMSSWKIKIVFRPWINVNKSRPTNQPATNPDHHSTQVNVSPRSTPVSSVPSDHCWIAQCLEQSVSINFISIYIFSKSSKTAVRVEKSSTRLKILECDRDKIWKFCWKICRNVQSMNLNVSEHLYLVYLSTCTRRAYISLTLFLQMRTSDMSSWFGHHRY